jgi:hypothetical protein
MEESTTIVNEGFLYIDNSLHDEHSNPEATFKKGIIVEIDGATICCGEIVPVMDYEEFEKNKGNIKYYTSKLKGKKVRIYKYKTFINTKEHNEVMISRECVIYPHDILMTDKEIKEQVDYELLEENTCYYATITLDKKIILTYKTNIKNPILEVPVELLEKDKAFKHHIEIKECLNKSAMETFRCEMGKEEDGLIFYGNDGQPFEFWTTIYHALKTQEKPYNIYTPHYYILMLNKYPLGNTYNAFFEDLHYDVDIYLKHYPEYKETFTMMSEKLNLYACACACEITTEDEDEKTNISKNTELFKINKLKELLCINKEYDCNQEKVVKILYETAEKYII